MKTASLALPSLILLTVVAIGAPSRPTAKDVVVRGGQDLSSLLARATLDATKNPSATRPVGIVVDVTPHVAAAAADIRAAVESLGDRVRHLEGSWRIAALGKRFGKAERHPSALEARVDRVLAEETPEVNTLRALERTLRSFPDRNGVVVYLADWHFEDDDGLERVISLLDGRGQSIRVIGSEACFGRGWNDGLSRLALGPDDHEPGIGRSPFGPREPDAPWHGGDTAYPHLPRSFANLPWKMEFALPVSERQEDLGDRIGRMRETRVGGRTFPLSSAFGPYALMRAAAETGGHYYLYSFNPDGRVGVEYDYSRCNRFEPDLRPRREILSGAKSRPIPQAMLRAWRRLADDSISVIDVTPPLTKSGAPAEIGRVPSGHGLRFAWQEKSDHDAFLRTVKKSMDALDKAIRELERALAGPRAAGEGDARQRADAELLLHILRVLRFELGEASAVAEEVPGDAWDAEGTIPAIHEQEWIRAGSVDDVTSVRPRDPKTADRIRSARRAHMDRFAGTPFGETVLRNPVVSYRYRPIRDLFEASRTGLGRTPSESGDRDEPTPRPIPIAPGGSSGGGSSSGR